MLFPVGREMGMQTPGVGGSVPDKVANAQASRWECTWCIGGHYSWSGVSREGGGLPPQMER